MEVLDTGHDKIRKICDTLKKETLEPAKKEAKEIIAKAIQEAEKIVQHAKDDAKSIYEENKKKMQKEKNVLQSSLKLACSQSIEALRQEVEENFFNKEIGKLFKEQVNSEQLIAQFINVVIQAIEKEGLKGDLEVIIPKHLSREEIAKKLTQTTISRLKDRPLILGDRQNGVEVKVKDHHMALEISDQTLLSLFASFLREEFRAMLFDTKPA